jgi:hypothetical protein
MERTQINQVVDTTSAMHQARALRDAYQQMLLEDLVNTVANGVRDALRGAERAIMSRCTGKPAAPI